MDDLPGIAGIDLSATWEFLNGWFAGWTLDFGSSFFDGSTWNIGRL